jgi:hypothetical protein
MRATMPSREVMARNWRESEVAPPPPAVSGPPPRALNLNHLLDLGNMIFFTFRGRPYGIPPLAMREGEKLLDVYLEIREYGDVDRSKLKGYFRAFKKVEKLVWRNVRPQNPFRRLLYALKLHRNSFRDVSEGELVELAVFCLARRTMSHGRTRILPNVQSPGT